MNLRFPEVFGVLLFIALLCSFALPRSVSGKIENTFQFVFAPVTGPIQWMTAGKTASTPADVPIVTEVSDEVTRLREEKQELTAYVEILHGQLQTLAQRQTEAERVGEQLRDIVTSVKVIGVDGAGRDVLRVSGTSATTVQSGQAVVNGNGIVGRVLDVGLGNQSSVRLITDRGFKLVGRFERFEHTSATEMELVNLKLEPTVLEGVGNGTLRIDSLKTADVQRAGLKVGDLVMLSEDDTTSWPIEVHGHRIGTVTSIGEKLEMPGVANILVKPEVDLMKLKEVWLVTTK